MKALLITTIEVLGMAGMFWIGKMSTEQDANTLRADAIKAGVAEYYIDANNERAFRWKGKQP